jgi:glycosyltransferase involved in cell wall biosynthesis
MDATPHISLVIPAFNEAAYLPRLLDSIDVARQRYAGRGGTDVEVVVADNLSTDGTADLAAARGCRVVEVATRNIGAVRNGGVRGSSGAIVATVDADHRVHPNTFLAIDEMMRNPRIIAGSSGAWPERWSLGIAATFAMLVPVVWLMKIDTGVVFCRREDFEAVGGYDEARPVAEDVAFLLALRRLGKGRGQRLARARGIKVIGSMRKFDQHGDWHYFRWLPKTPRMMRNRMSDRFLSYWYKPDR